jgi:putative ABC transport system permease protein
MNKKLFTQIKNEWRGNTWLAIELLVVSVVMWFITDMLYVRIATYLEPRGFDISHCYLIEMGMLNEKSPDYVEYSKGDEQRDVLELLNRIQHRPDVEAASLSINSYPYNGSNGTTSMQLQGDSVIISNWLIRRFVTPDFVRVFRYEGANGETPEQLAQMLEEGKFLASENVYNHKKLGNRNLKDYIGKPFYLHGDTTQTYTLGTALKTVRYDDFQQARNSYSMMQKIYWYRSYFELCVRVRPEHDKDFIARLKADSESQYRIGNVFISNIRSFKDIRQSFQQRQYNEMRNNYTGMAFLLVNIFLGLLGTFWFRTQQRKSEIALHKAHGATNQMVFTRLLSEGWLLLLIVTPIALLIDFNLAHAELNAWHNGTTLEWDRLLFCGGISFALIALMIAIGIGIPARKAMKIDPAEALHNE